MGTDKLQILRRAAAVEEMFVLSIGAKKWRGKNRASKCEKKTSLFTQL